MRRFAAQLPYTPNNRDVIHAAMRECEYQIELAFARKDTHIRANTWRQLGRIAQNQEDNRALQAECLVNLFESDKMLGSLDPVRELKLYEACGKFLSLAPEPHPVIGKLDWQTQLQKGGKNTAQILEEGRDLTLRPSAGGRVNRYR